MRVIGFLSVDRFYTADFEPTEPLVVCRSGVVLDANEPARRLGIAVGMGKEEAKAILAGAGQQCEWQAAPFEAQAKSFLDALARVSDAVEPTDQHEAFIDLSGHPDPVAIGLVVRDLASETLGLPVRIGIARCRWLAELACRRDELSAFLHRPAGHLANLSLNVLPVERAVRDRLSYLGYRLVGEVKELPAAVLQAQFGDLSLSLKQLARGAGDGVVHAKYPERSLTKSLTFAGAPDTEEALQAGAMSVARDLGESLRSSDLGGAVVELRLEHEEQPPTDQTRTFTRPLCSPGTVASAVGLMLSELPEHPVTRVRVRLLELRPTKHIQHAFPGIVSPVHDRTPVDQALKRLKDTFGEGIVQKASEVAEPRYKRVRRAWREANGWNW